MNSKVLLLCLVFAVLMTWLAVEVDACGFPMAAPICCGGGGGCGCGRKKREIGQYPSSQVSVSSSASIIIPSDRTEEILPCPQNEWLGVLVRNMNADPRESAKAIKQGLYNKYQSQFFVACTPKGQQRAFVANGEGYCTAENETLWCHAAAILG